MASQLRWATFRGVLPVSTYLSLGPVNKRVLGFTSDGYFTNAQLKVALEALLETGDEEVVNQFLKVGRVKRQCFSLLILQRTSEKYHSIKWLFFRTFFSTTTLVSWSAWT